MNYSERQHELQQNALAAFLVKANTAIEPYSKPIAVGVTAVFALLIGGGIYTSRASDNRSDATLQLIEAAGTGDIDSLSQIAANYPDTSAAAWSMLYQGGQKMAAGFSSLFNSRAEAEELLDEAERAYEDALAMSDDIVIQSRAQFGLARISEALGEVDEAITRYEAAAEAGESEAMIAEARQRINRLSQPQAQAFLAWFNEQDFSPAEPSLPPSLPDLEELPDVPTIELPDTTVDDLTVDTDGVEVSMPAEATSDDETEGDEAADASDSATDDDAAAESTPPESDGDSDSN
ncbi:MAG: tetratricopeptide repeat protein [Planctomycetota bacterium]